MWSKLLVLCLLVIILSAQKIIVASTVNGYYFRSNRVSYMDSVFELGSLIGS